MAEQCNVCGGDKEVFGETCEACFGTGRKLTTSEIQTVYREQKQLRARLEATESRIKQFESIASIRFEVCDTDENNPMPTAEEYFAGMVAFRMGHAAGTVGHEAMLEAYKSDPRYKAGEAYCPATYFVVGYEIAARAEAAEARENKLREVAHDHIEKAFHAAERAMAENVIFSKRQQRKRDVLAEFDAALAEGGEG